MSDSLLTKTAKAMHRADEAPASKPDWGSLPKTTQRRYEVMAAAALSIALREDVYETDFEAELEAAASGISPSK